MNSKVSGFLRLAKKSRKAAKKKRIRDGAQFIDKDEALGNLNGISEAESVPSPALQKQKRLHWDAVKQPVQEIVCSTEKHVKFVETKSNMGSRQDSKQDPSNGKIWPKDHRPEHDKSDTFWSQKASWSSLVGESGHFAFNLHSVLAGNGNTPDVRMKQPVAVEECTSACIEGSGFPTLSVYPDPSNRDADTTPTSQRWHTSGTFESQDKFEFCTQPTVKTKPAGDFLNGIGQCDRDDSIFENHKDNIGANACTFMRSENYEQEWLTAKRAAKEVLKRTRKDALRSMKMFHFKNTS